MVVSEKAAGTAEHEMEKVKLTAPERAARVWQMLVLAARNQQLLSHARVSSFTGIPQEELAEALERIHRYCKSNHYPLLNCLVVDRATGLPGDEFPEKLDRLAMKVEQAKVFDFDWRPQEKLEAYDFLTN